MSIRVTILTKSKQAIVKEIKPRAGHYKMDDGLYVLAPDAIANYSVKGNVKGSEIYFFEGNPNPLSSSGVTDKSDTFMNEFVLVNALEQTSLSTKMDLSKLGAVMSNVGGYFKDPTNIIWFLFYAVIAYAIINGLMGGGLV